MSATTRRSGKTVGRRVAGAVTRLLALSLVAGCNTGGGGDRAGTTSPSTPTATSSPSSSFPSPSYPSQTATSETSVSLPPPPPPTDCPDTPVVLVANDTVLGCAVTPSSWTIHNRSRTVLLLAPDSRVLYQDLGGAVSPVPAWSTMWNGAVARWRHPSQGWYWLQPDDTVRITWQGPPGRITYTPDPSESAARAALVEVLARMSNRFQEEPKAASVSQCLGTVGTVAKPLFNQQQTSFTTSWNTAIEDGLGAVGCAELMHDAAGGEAERPATIAAVREGTAPVLETAAKWVGKARAIFRG